ncbi:MAG: polysaccharide deacetylase family protein [Gaiellaceae bacterium]
MVRGSTLVVCYHAVSSDWVTDMAVTPAVLATHAKAMMRQGYRPSTLSDALTDGSHEKRFAITFDDGFESVFTQGFPVLRELGVPATVFVCTDFVSKHSLMDWPAIARYHQTAPRDELRAVSWDEARQLAAAGWEIGSHTCSHPLLTTLTDEEIDHELRASREVCRAELGTACAAFAYPQSDHDQRVMQRVEAAGYSWACTLPDGFTGAQRYAWPRIGAYASDGPVRFRLKASPSVRWARSTRLGWIAERVARRVLPLQQPPS